MYSITIYLNNDKKQAKVIKGMSIESCLYNTVEYLVRYKPDFCLRFDDDMPIQCVNYTESYNEYEVYAEGTDSDPDYASADYADCIESVKYLLANKIH